MTTSALLWTYAKPYLRAHGRAHAGTTVSLNRRMSRIAATSLALLVTTVVPMERAESAIKTSFTSGGEPATWYPRDQSM